jgi:hypothetical protein
MGRRDRIEQRRKEMEKGFPTCILCFMFFLGSCTFIFHHKFEVSKCGVELLRFSWSLLGYHFVD